MKTVHIRNTWSPNTFRTTYGRIVRPTQLTMNTVETTCKQCLKMENERLLVRKSWTT